MHNTLSTRVCVCMCIYTPLYGTRGLMRVHALLLLLLLFFSRTWRAHSVCVQVDSALGQSKEQHERMQMGTERLSPSGPMQHENGMDVEKESREAPNSPELALPPNVTTRRKNRRKASSSSSSSSSSSNATREGTEERQQLPTNDNVVAADEEEQVTMLSSRADETQGAGEDGIALPPKNVDAIPSASSSAAAAAAAAAAEEEEVEVDAPRASDVAAPLTLNGTTITTSSSPSSHAHEQDEKRTSPLSRGGDYDADNEVQRLTVLNAALSSKVESLSSRVAEAEDETDRVTCALEEARERLATSERTVHAMTKERDELRRKAERADEAAGMIAQRDDTIRQVMQEGEALSIKQAEYEQTMKKLRAKIRQMEAERVDVQEQLEAEHSKAEERRAEVSALESKYDAEMQQAKARIEAAETRVGQEAALRSSAVQRETSAKEEALNETVAGLRSALSMQEEQSALKEEMLRKTINEQKVQLHESEARNEELAARLPGATRPLMRQLEAMHRQMEESSASWSATEKSLMRRVTESQAAAAAAVERERMMRDGRAEDVSKLAAADAQCDTLRRELQSVQNQLHRTNEVLRESRAELDRVRQARDADAEERLRRSRELEETIATLTANGERHKDRITVLETELRESKRTIASLDQDLQQRSDAAAATAAANAVAAAAAAATRRGGDADKATGGSGGSDADADANASSSLSGVVVSRDEAKAGGGGSSVAGGMRYSARNVPLQMEALQSELRRRDGELAAAKEQIASLVATRNRLADELLTSSQGEEELRSARESLTRLEAEYSALQEEHVSALELMGERDEQVEDLQADLADIRAVFRSQIDEMATQLIEAKKTTTTTAATTTS